MMTVTIEGPKGSGKTISATKLANATGTVYHHGGRTNFSSYAGQDVILCDEDVRLPADFLHEDHVRVHRKFQEPEHFPLPKMIIFVRSD